jgi:hypothetical protein
MKRKRPSASWCSPSPSRRASRNPRISSDRRLIVASDAQAHGSAPAALILAGELDVQVIFAQPHGDFVDAVRGKPAGTAVDQHAVFAARCSRRKRRPAGSPRPSWGAEGKPLILLAFHKVRELQVATVTHCSALMFHCGTDCSILSWRVLDDLPTTDRSRSIKSVSPTPRQGNSKREGSI